MALITCTECGKEFSDMAPACPHCGCPTEYVKQTIIDKKREEEPVKCPFCGSESIDSCGYCNECGQKIPPSVFEKTPQPQYTSQPHENHSTYAEDRKPFSGVYRYSLFGKKTEVYCPRCGSENCFIYREQTVIPEKTKTRYTMNLNPLKPFTILNKKEKVVRKERTITESKFMCNDCGKIFS